MSKKRIKFKDYINNSLNGMAIGLFSSLILGLIFKQVGQMLGLDKLLIFGDVAQKMMGPAIGVGVAYSIGAPNLGIISAVVTGAIGAGTLTILESGESIALIGDPVGAYIAALLGAEVSKLLDRKSSLEILIIPIFSILAGGLTGNYISPILSRILNDIGGFINNLTMLHPLPMGILVSLFMGMLLTLPISSAAIAISLNLSGLAAGAATAGCSANMIGFAVISLKDNGLGRFLAQALGTSMLQISNILKNPVIWLPSIVASIILGPISTMILKLESNPMGAGMGTSGLVGQIAMIETMGYSKLLLLQIIVLHILLPALISYFVYFYLKSKGSILSGDMKI